MLKLILVDDEPSVLRGMTAAVSWEELGYQLCGTASNGYQALELIEACHPELVITDVKMPEMDGIALSRNVKEQWPDTEIIIISGYSDFDYARSAISYGVCEYLLKPTEIQQLESALCKVGTRIKKKQEYRRDFEKIHSELKKLMPLLNSQLLADITNGITPFNEDIKERLVQQGFGLSFLPYYLCCFDIDAGVETEEAEYRCWVNKQFRETAERCFHEICRTEFFQIQDRQFFITEVSGNKEEFLEKLTLCCSEAIHEFTKTFTKTAFAGISQYYDSYTFLNTARRDCAVALEYRYSRDAGPCILFEEVNRFSGSNACHYDQRMLEDILLYARMLDTAGVLERFNKLCNYITEKNVLFSQLYSTVLMILLELYQLCIDTDSSPEAVWEAISDLHRYSTLESMRSFVMQTLENVIGDVRRNVNEKNAGVVEEIMRYVRENLCKGLSLNEIAEHIHFSKNYLCALFKRETGETLVKYITRERITRAKQLLKSPEFKIHEVSEAVGGTDYFYFAQVFKKHVGVTMSEYREAYANSTGDLSSK